MSEVIWSDDKPTAPQLVKFAELILDAYGTLRPSPFGQNSVWYVDGTIALKSNYNGLDLEITRMPMPTMRMEGSNPVIMVANGKIIRTHGEQYHIIDHMINMVNMLSKDGVVY